MDASIIACVVVASKMTPRQPRVCGFSRPSVVPIALSPHSCEVKAAPKTWHDRSTAALSSVQASLGYPLIAGDCIATLGIDHRKSRNGPLVGLKPAMPETRNDWTPTD